VRGLSTRMTSVFVARPLTPTLSPQVRGEGEEERMSTKALNKICWRVEKSPVPYEQALIVMEDRVRAIRDDGAEDMVWLLEHPPLYTAGTSAKAEDLLEKRFPVYTAGRGGQYTYHGPGQRVAYAMIDLHKRGDDVRAYVRDLEEWIIRALAEFGVEGRRREGLVGIWVGNEKIAAIGVRVRKWVAYHGIAVNLDPDLSHYAGIVPCGVKDAGVTSLKALGIAATMDDLDAALRRGFAAVFGL
jgi:lipoyl(octanoyl) transferase